TASRSRRASMRADHCGRLADARAKTPNRIARKKLSADLALGSSPVLEGKQRGLRRARQRQHRESRGGELPRQFLRQRHHPLASPLAGKNVAGGIGDRGSDQESEVYGY